MAIYTIGKLGMKASFMGAKAAKGMLKGLYFGKRKIGKTVQKVADKAGKEGFAKTSKFLTGVRKKAHVGSKELGKTIKENPKLSSFIGGIGTYKFFDDE